jgi:putative Holliday junction resolvase
MTESKKQIKYIGIDWGEKRIGLAAADNETWMAVPLAIVYSFDELLEFLAKEEPDLLVVGMPYTMAGNEGETAGRVNDFIKMIQTSSPYAVVTVDERLSSSAIDSLYHDKKSPEERDAISAMLILQGYIDGLDKGIKKEEKKWPSL